jgi:TatA/E family protein of Tat protein translocase
MFDNPVAILIVVVLIVLLFVGPKRLPMLSRSIGESIKEFKGGISEDKQVGAAPDAVKQTESASETSKTSS